MDEIKEIFSNNGFSRLPVYKDTIDNVIGLIHQRDFFTAYLNGEKEVSHLVQKVVFTSEYTRISTLLKQLQKQKIHMAAVSDE
jgi:CBS domain containing-hemolysin-like protein